MTSLRHPQRAILDNGSDIFLNPLKIGWVIDIFAPDSEDLDEPTYHAYYDNEQDALSDFHSWKR